MRYSVLELSTAVKPWLLRHIMSETGAPVTYLDPDIRIYGSLNLLDELAASHGVVLIPHNNVPIPADGRKPSQVDIMIAGVYNLGYVTVAPGQEVDGLLDWWADRLRRDCRVDPVWGYFVDQRWFDLAPGFLTDVAIMREPEYNVAYWNLHARRLAYGEGSYSVDGRPLRFFHFSGFDPKHPLVLSRYQNRVDVLADPVLEQLLSEYATEVLDAGHQTSRSWAYGYTALGDGTPLDAWVRTLYDRFAAERADVPSPFTPDGASEFVQWLAQEPPGAPSGVSRVLASVYEERPDLRGAYPNLNGADRDRLLAWAQEYGRHEIPLACPHDDGCPGRAGAVRSHIPQRRSGCARPAAKQRSSDRTGRARGAVGAAAQRGVGGQRRRLLPLRARDGGSRAAARIGSGDNGHSGAADPRQHDSRSVGKATHTRRRHRRTRYFR